MGKLVNVGLLKFLLDSKLHFVMFGLDPFVFGSTFGYKLCAP
jgi:hypothetical protein